MTLNTKLAFEIWTGIVLLIVVIGGVAGVTLLMDNNATSVLTRTQANNPQPSPSSFLSESEIQNASLGISQTLLGGTQP